MNKFTESNYKSPLLCEEYSKYTHTSGLEVYIFPKKMSTSFALFGAKYGSIHNSFTDADGSTVTVPDGIAHFLEHKLFCCEDGSDAFEHFSALGADANAYTSFNRTAYHFSCSENFYESLSELVDFVTHPYFTDGSVANEVGIIGEEIAMYDDSPSDRCFYGMLEGMYRAHSIRKNICGSARSIREITPKLLYDCHSVFYRPDNMVLIICGDIDGERALSVVDSSLPKDFCGRAAFKVNENKLESPCVEREYVEQKMPTSKPMFSIGFKDTDIPTSPTDRQKKDAEMAIVNEVLFSRAGELYSYLFENKMISPALSCGYTITESFAYNSVNGEADDPRAVLEYIKKYIGEALTSGLCREDFERAKRVMYAESVRIFDSTEGIGNTLFSFLSDNTEPLSQADIIGRVTYEDACRRFEAFFSKPSITLSVVKN